MHSYRLAGLSVDSEFALPGLIGIAPGQGAFDVTIRRRPVPLSLDGASNSGPTWQIDGDRFLLRIPDVARFLLTAGREIAFETENGTPTEDVSIFLVGSIFGILLHQRENVVLHASAVRVGGKAVLFCGASGAGKSTIAAALDRQGYPVVSDDVCAIDVTPSGQIIVQPDGRLLKLWNHTIENLQLADSKGAAVRNRLEKFYVEPDAAFDEPLPLGAVYELREARPPHAPGIERPNVVDSALLLRRNAYRPLLVRRFGQKANYFHAATAMANSAGIFHLTRSLDFARVPDVISWLRDHWAEIGLLEAAAA